MENLSELIDRGVADKMAYDLNETIFVPFLARATELTNNVSIKMWIPRGEAGLSCMRRKVCERSVVESVYKHSLSRTATSGVGKFRLTKKIELMSLYYFISKFIYILSTK